VVRICLKNGACFFGLRFDALPLGIAQINRIGRAQFL
jgi:hypothetical protein